MKKGVKAEKETEAIQTSKKKGGKREKELASFKELLLKQKKEKENILAAAENSETEQRQLGAGTNNSIEHLHENPFTSEFGDNSTIIKKKRKCLASINIALEKIEKDQDSFGICEECKEEIPIARLKNVPYAERCVPCEEAFEARDKINNSPCRSFKTNSNKRPPSIIR